MKLMPIKDLLALYNYSKNVDFSVNPDLTYNSASDLIEVIDINKILGNVTIDNGQFKNELSTILESIIKMHIFTVDFNRFLCLTQIKEENKDGIGVYFSLHIEDNKISYFYRNITGINSTVIVNTIESKDDLLIYSKKTIIHKKNRDYDKICNNIESEEEGFIYSDGIDIFRLKQNEVENYYIDSITKKKLLCDKKPKYTENITSWNEAENEISENYKKISYKEDSNGVLIPSKEEAYKIIYLDQIGIKRAQELFNENIIGKEELDEILADKIKKMALK